MDNVRAAIVELLASGEVPNIAEVAERSNVTARSIYRYFGSADAAVADALDTHRDRVLVAFRSEPTISRNAPFDERLAMMVLRRLRLQELVEPTGHRLVDPPLIEALDQEVRRAFVRELAGDDGTIDFERAATVCGLFRIPTIASMRSAFGGDDVQTSRALCDVVSSVLGVGRED